MHFQINAPISAQRAPTVLRLVGWVSTTLASGVEGSVMEIKIGDTRPHIAVEATDDLPFGLRAIIEQVWNW